MSPTVMGVDPGVSGGLAVVRGDGAMLRTIPFYPKMSHQGLVYAVYDGLDVMKANNGSAVYVEKVGVMPTDGRKGANTFGRVDGLIRGALIAYGFPPFDVMPMAWQASLGCLTGGNKNVSKNRAKELWPSWKWTHAIADAALIAEFGRRRLASRQPGL